LNIKKTKIICTIGPSVETVEKISGLIEEGMDAARLNFSHSNLETHELYLKNIREACKQTGKNIAIIQDLQGPKIRVGKLENGFIALIEGETVKIISDEIIGNSETFSTSYPGIIYDAMQGETILLDDGNLKLQIVSIDKNLKEIVCKVLTGGILKERKGINLPHTEINLPSLTEKDLIDLDFGLKHNIDFIAMSFVRSADEIKLLRGILKSKNKNIPIIAKIERPEAIKNIDEIIHESDLVMVARGDLGVEISAEEVPLLQKMIIKKCNEKIKPVITATQMLESMINEPTPTRAEASDIANSILDGTDCVMLSAETSIGKYPIESVRIMKKIILRSETIKKSSFFREIFVEDSPENTLHTICNSATVIAARLNAKAIITLTQTGKSPLLLSNHRPVAPIIAATTEEHLFKRCRLIWGVEPILFDKNHTYKDIIHSIRQRILDQKILEQGNKVIILASSIFNELESANMIEVGEV
jgi:pyruvate kinase